MDLNYDISTWTTSLREMCLTSVSYNIVKATTLSKQSRYGIEDIELMESAAIERVQQIHWPPEVESLIKMRIPLIAEEMFDWHNRHYTNVRPVMTPFCTLDETASARLLIYTDTRIMSRVDQFSIACVYCLEEEIFLFGKQLTTLEIELKRRKVCKKLNDTWATSLEQFWLNMYNGCFDAPISLKDISEEYCVEGYLLANRTVAKKYFLEKAPKENTQHFICTEPLLDDGFHDFVYEELYNLPCIIAKLFELIHNDRLEVLKSTLFERLLIALLDWPYQHLFLQAARLLVDGLKKKQHITVTISIARKVISNCEDYNYKGLFIGFWKIGTDQKSELLQNHACCRRVLMYQVFSMKDEILTSFFLDYITDEHKENHLFTFNENCSCHAMIMERQYEALEILVRVCQLKEEKLFEKFQSFLRNPPFICVPGSCAHNVRKAKCYQEFQQIMVKYLP